MQRQPARHVMLDVGFKVKNRSHPAMSRVMEALG
jgi:hypothetical protein